MPTNVGMFWMEPFTGGFYFVQSVWKTPSLSMRR
jgi:hypothetical protein